MKTTVFSAALILFVGCTTPKDETAPKYELSERAEQEMLKNFAKHYNLHHRFALQRDREISTYYGVLGIPQMVLIDQKGNVRMIKVGSGEQNARDLENLTRELLGLTSLKEPADEHDKTTTKSLADSRNILRNNPNDLNAYNDYMRSFSAQFYSLLNNDSNKAETLVNQEKEFIDSLEKPSDEKVNFTYQRLLYTPTNYRTLIKVETSSLDELKIDLESNPGSSTARRLYQMKVSREIPSSLIYNTPAAAEKKVQAEKKFLESIRSKVTEQIKDPDSIEKVTASINSLIERYLGGIERRIASAKRHEELLTKGKIMPLPDLDWVNGSAMTDEDLKGKVVLLDFWAVWCGPCIATIPHLRDWHENYSDKGLEVIGVTSYYKRYDWQDGKLVRLEAPKQAK